MLIPTVILEGCYQDYTDVKDIKRQNEGLGLYKELYPEKAKKFIISLKK